MLKVGVIRLDIIAKIGVQVVAVPVALQFFIPPRTAGPQQAQRFACQTDTLCLSRPGSCVRRCCGSSMPQSSLAEGLFGYKAPPDSGLPNREVIRWVQGLDLTLSVTNFRRGLANGFLVAQILHKYYPDVQLHSFSNGTSTATRRDNWEQIQKLCGQKNVLLPSPLVDGTIKGSPGSAVALLEHLYEKLTKKSVQKLPPPQLAASEGPTTQHRAAGAFASTTAGDAEDVPINATAGSKPILTNLQTGAGVDFGAVKIDAVDDAVRLRQKLAAASQRPVPAS